MIMKFISFTAFLVLFPFLSQSFEVLSVRPEVVSPGDKVYVSIPGAVSPAYMLIEGYRLKADESTSGLFIFTVPSLSPGRYALSFHVGEDKVETSLYLSVIEPHPQIFSLSPSIVPECSTETIRQVNVSGKYFSPGSNLFLGGSVVAATVIDSRNMSFEVPILKSGVYGVQVANSPDKKSLPFSLYVSSVPRIDSVNIGDEFTNYYELIITGDNFFPQSSLLINESRSGLDGTPPRQRAIFGQSRRLEHGDYAGQVQGDYLFFRDCRTLIYYRFPLSSQKEERVLQVVNPDGKATEAFSILAN